VNTRAAFGLVAAAGLTSGAAARESIRYTWSWHEGKANTSVPVFVNGIVDPGEGARLVLTATITPGIGSTVTYQAPPAPGHGTIAGLASIFFDLIGTGANGGTWAVNRRNPGGVNWGLGPFGDPQANGDLTSGSAGQFVLPGFLANPTNPVVAIWSMTWTPSDYTPRTASFQSQGAAAGMGNHSAILIAYGEDPNSSDPLYVGRFIDGNFGNTGSIPIVPAPGAGVVLGLGLLAITRRRKSGQLSMDPAP